MEYFDNLDDAREYYSEYDVLALHEMDSYEGVFEVLEISGETYFAVRRDESNN